jgi:hypothetical protein
LYSSSEKEAKWHLEIWCAGVFGYYDDDLPWALYEDKDWNLIVNAYPGTYLVECVNTTPDGILSKYRGIMFKTYVW